MKSTDSRRIFGLGTLVLAISLFVPSGLALQVTPGSSCAAYCLDDAKGDPYNPNDSTTTVSDIVCNDDDYWSTSTGTKFRTCVNCLQNSTAVNGTENDVEWYLYNIRFAVDVCLFSYPSSDSKNASLSSPCALSNNCQPLQTALTTNVKNPDKADLQYCSADDGGFESPALVDCQQCLQADPRQTYVSNFLTALSAGCKQKPPAGDLLGLNGTLFSKTAMSIVTPTWNQTAVPKVKPVTTMSTGTIVGIVLGIVLLLVGAMALFIFYWRRQKRGSSDPFTDVPSRPTKSISSSISGAYVPYYTTDYKNQKPDQRNIELYDKIKTQHVVVPARKVYESDFPETATAGLWGRDTPLHPRQQLLSGMHSARNGSFQHQLVFNSNSTNNADSSTGLDEMPTHPAFIPRAFTRPSRNPRATVQTTEAPVKSNKPDTYAIQRYLDAVEDTSTIDVASLVSPPLPTSNTTKTTHTVTSVASNPFVSSQDTPKFPPPPPGPPPAQGDSVKGSTPYKSPQLTPSLVLPSMSRVRSPRRYIPPPLNIGETEPRSRVNRPESGMP